MTLLTFKNKYVVQSSTNVATASTSFVDDTAAIQTFSLVSPQTILVIYQSYGNSNATNQYGAINAINIDGTDRAISRDGSGWYAPWIYRNMSFWIGSLAAGSHTIKGRVAVPNSSFTYTIKNRILLVYIFNGNEFQYIDDSIHQIRWTEQSGAGPWWSVPRDDPYATVTFTPSAPCKALYMYNISNNGNDNSAGKQALINIAGVDYSQAEKSTGGTNSDSVFTCHANSLTVTSTTVKGRVKGNDTNYKYVDNRQFGVLLLDDSTLLDSITSDVQVSAASNALVDDSQATISRSTTDTRELLVLAFGTKRYNTNSNYSGEAYGISIDTVDKQVSRAMGANISASPWNAESEPTCWAQTLTSGTHTIQGRFSNNYAAGGNSGDLAVISSRRIFASYLAVTSFTITSTPAGAEIWLAPHGGAYVDQLKNTNPGNNTIIVAPGAYDIKLTLGGYLDYIFSNQTITAGQALSLDATLTLAPGLSISSTPTGAEIYLALSPGTPLDQGLTTIPGGRTISNLVTGTYNVRLTLPGYQDWTGTVDTIAETVVPLSATFAGSANITSTPSGAEIFINDVDQGVTTPHIFTGMTDGSYSLKLTLLHYYDLTDTFTITAGTTTNVSKTLNPSTGTLSISSTPSGASIYIDNTLQPGITTPANILYLSPGSHTYRLTLAGYADTSGSFTITAGITTNLPVTFLGSLNVSSTPSGATIYIDNVLQPGITTPATITGLSAGSHTYKLTLTGYADYTGSFSITAGTTTNLPVIFLGSLNVSSTPSGARIFVDEVDKGLNTPNIVTGLSSGSHAYRLALTGYSDAVGMFSIIAGQTTTISPTPILSPLVAGITNGDFTNDLVGWSSIGPGVSWVPNEGKVDINRNAYGCITYGPLLQSSIEQSFTIDSNSLSFFWNLAFVNTPSTDVPEYVRYNFYVDRVLTNTGQMSALRSSSMSQTVTLDTSSYIGRSGRIIFYPLLQSYCPPSGFLYITLYVGNVTTHGNLNISSTPSGASVYIDDSPTPSGTTPLTVTDLTGGSHTYKLSMSAYQDYTSSASITAGSTTSVSATLTPATGSVTITSTPSDADVWISGSPLVYKGTTPITISNLDPGTYDYKLTKTGYYDETGTFSIASNVTTTLDVPLTLVLGAITLSSTPTNAEIWLAPTGSPLSDQGVTTTATIGGLTPGIEYTYELRLTDYYPKDGTFTLVDGETITMSETLSPVPCPSLPRYKDNTVTLQATPRDGIGPYYVEFIKDGIMINPSRLDGTNPITSAPEDTTITRHYILDNDDILSAVSGTMDFEVFMSDSCPTEAKTCDQICTINIGCLSPVCNFTIT